MDGPTLWKHLHTGGIGLEQLAEKTGYNLAYLLQIVSGYAPLSDQAKFRIVKAYPELADALMADALINKEAAR